MQKSFAKMLLLLQSGLYVTLGLFTIMVMMSVVSGDSIIQKKKCYYAPINSTKQGEQVDIHMTTPYTAMQLNLNPLEQCLMSLS